jgi:putative (di)nucleoside polyphosphate hydrolase
MDCIDTDGFRANVGIILTDGDGMVLLAGRTGQPGWQFPQGGINQEELPEEAMFRELDEELGLAPDHVEMLGTTREWVRYRLPERYIRKSSLPLCIGQKQRWYLLRLKASEDSVRLDSTSDPEFDRWRWVEYWHPVKEVIHFKRRVYVHALSELGPLMFPDGLPNQPNWWPKSWLAAPDL